MGAYIVMKGENVVAEANAYRVGMAGELNLYYGELIDVPVFISVDPLERVSLTLAPGQWDSVHWDEDED